MSETIATASPAVFHYWNKRVGATPKAWAGLEKVKQQKIARKNSLARLVYKHKHARTMTHNFDAHVWDWIEFYHSDGLIFTIKKNCYSATGVKFFKVTGETRDSKTIAARFAVVYLLREHTGLSSTMIGRHVGGRDHSSILNAVAQAKQALKTPVRNLTEKQKMMVNNIHELSQRIADIIPLLAKETA